MGYLFIIDFIFEILFGTDLTGFITNLISGGPDDILTTVETGRITEFRVQQSRYGTPIFMGLGTVRLSGNVIWAGAIEEVEERRTKCNKKGGGLTGLFAKKICHETVSFYYRQSFALGFSKGPAIAFRRIWADGKLILDLTEGNTAETTVLVDPIPVPGGEEDDNTFAGGVTGPRRVSSYFTFHYGDANQTVDDLIAGAEGVENTPLHPDLVYVMFNGVFLQPFGNRIPSLSAEISFVNSIVVTLVAGSHDTFTANDFWIPEEVSPYLYAKSTTDWFVIDKLTGTIIFKYPFTGTNNLIAPFADQQSQFYTSQQFNGTDGELIQYDLITGDLLARYGYATPSEALKSIAFDTTNLKVFGTCDEGEFDFPMIADDALDPLVRDTTSFNTYVNNGTNGTAAKDVVITSNGIRYALRANTASPGLTYLTKYYADNLIANKVVGPLSHANHVNSLDSSINFEDADFVITFGNFLLIGGITGGYIAKYSIVSDTVVAYNGSVTIQVGDKSNMNVYDNLIRLSSGEVLFFSDLTLDRTINYADYDDLTHGTFTTAIFIPSTQSYLFDDNTDGFIGQERYAANPVPLETAVVGIITTYQPETRPAIGPNDVEASDLTGVDLDGYALITQKAVKAQILPLTQAYFFDVLESSGKIKFVTRGQASSFSIVENDIAQEYPGETVKPLVIKRHQESEQLKEVAINYTDKDNDYLRNTQTSRRIQTSAITRVTKHLPIVLTANQAFHSASFLLQSTWIGREEYTFTLPTKFADVEPTDIMTITMNSGTVFVARIRSISVEPNGLINVEAMAEETAIYTDANPAGRDSGNTTFQPAVLINSKSFIVGVFDTAFMTDEIGNTAIVLGGDSLVQYTAGEF